VRRDKVVDEDWRHHISPVTHLDLLGRNGVACLIGHVPAHCMEVHKSRYQPGLHKSGQKKSGSKNEPPCEGHVAQIHKEGDVFGEHCEEDDVGREVLDRRNVGSLLGRILWIEAGIGGRCFSGLRHCVVGWRF